MSTVISPASIPLEEEDIPIVSQQNGKLSHHDEISPAPVESATVTTSNGAGKVTPRLRLKLAGVSAARESTSADESPCVANSAASSCASNSPFFIIVEEQTPRTQKRSNLVKTPVSRRSTSEHYKKKIVSFSSETADRKISCATDCLSYMINGSNLIKVKSSTRRYQRYFIYDSEFGCIRWSPTTKKAEKAKIPVDSIKEIRVGRNTENLRNSQSCFEDLGEDCAFSIIWNDDYQYLDLIANSPDEANIWITGLVALTSGNVPSAFNTSEASLTLRDTMLEKFFDENYPSTSSDNLEDELDDSIFLDLVRKISPRLPSKNILQKKKEIEYYAKLDSISVSSLRKEFCEVYRYVATRPEIYFLLVRYANKDYLTADDLQIFLETEQGIVGASLDMCKELIRRYEPFEAAALDGKMTVDGLTSYLVSGECDLFDAQTHQRVCQDMSQPFANYFVHTACCPLATTSSAALQHVDERVLHHRAQGPAMLRGYADALMSGSRFIEIDVHENDEEPDGEPVVCHGQAAATATNASRVALREVLVIVRKYAFYSTQYPLIVQLDCHLDVGSQKVMADMLKSVLGDLLYIDDGTFDLNVEEKLPSPETYRGKILIKSRKLPFGSTEEGLVSEEDEAFEKTRATRLMKKSHSTFSKKRALCLELSDLVCPFLQSFTITDFPTILERQKWYQIGSLNESFALKLSAHFSHDFVLYTSRYTTRVYPNAARVDGSNLNPQEFWNCGCQLVSLNLQTPGLMVDLARGKFLANGKCGYVLKPLVMRDTNASFSPREAVNTLSSQTLHIKVISAQQLPRPRGSTAKGDSLDPFVIVEVFGLPCDCAEERTRTVQNESFNPIFDESFQFDVSLPELTLIRFLVLDDDYISDDFIGQYTLPFECLQTGYRHITLLDIDGQPMENVTLFIHIAVTNKRGGGKAKKRGVSVRRRNFKVHTGIKQIGIKQLDDVFKQCLPVLTECVQLRTGLENELTQWQECCGLGPAATMRQGLRLIHSRLMAAAASNAQGSAESASQLAVDIETGYPKLEIDGSVPDMLRKSSQSFESVVAQCKRIIERSEYLISKVEDHSRRVSETYQEVCSAQADSRLKGQQATRAAENYMWNTRLVKSQSEIMSKIHDECQEHIKQIVNTACLLNVLKVQCQQPCAHRTQQANII